MTKFPLAIYHKCSTRDSCSVKLNNRKIWHNIYRTEFIIRLAVPLMGQPAMELTLENLFYEKFPIKDKKLLASGFPRVSDFIDDYYKIYLSNRISVIYQSGGEQTFILIHRRFMRVSR